MTQKTINVLHLYPNSMNIYGDMGNVLTIKRRLEWHGYQPNVIGYNQGDEFPAEVDIIIGGGGQDSGQLAVQDDLIKIKDQIQELATRGAPMLVICGLYQLFGHRFLTGDGTEIKGIGLLDVDTIAGSERMIGNIITDSDDFGPIVGFENHSGKTTLGPNATPLAKVRLGAGNNGQDETEGARQHNIIGSYLHGSLLPRNPKIADWLIEKAVINRYGQFKAAGIDDSIATKARQTALKLSR